MTGSLPEIEPEAPPFVAEWWEVAQPYVFGVLALALVVALIVHRWRQ